MIDSRKEFEVTVDDIENGLRSNNDKCALALAASRELDSSVAVINDVAEDLECVTVIVYQKPPNYGTEVLLARIVGDNGQAKMVNWLYAFDSGKYVQPIKVEVLPENLSFARGA